MMATIAVLFCMLVFAFAAYKGFSLLDPSIKTR